MAPEPTVKDGDCWGLAFFVSSKMHELGLVTVLYSGHSRSRGWEDQELKGIFGFLVGPGQPGLHETLSPKKEFAYYLFFVSFISCRENLDSRNKLGLGLVVDTLNPSTWDTGWWISVR